MAAPTWAGSTPAGSSMGYRTYICGNYGFLDCPHNPDPRLGYLEWHEDARRRYARGERQRFCLVCRKYVWGYLWPDPPEPAPQPSALDLLGISWEDPYKGMPSQQ